MHDKSFWLWNGRGIACEGVYEPVAVENPHGHLDIDGHGLVLQFLTEVNRTGCQQHYQSPQFFHVIRCELSG
jgi:hypothetical protein